MVLVQLDRFITRSPMQYVVEAERALFEGPPELRDLIRRTAALFAQATA